MTIREIGFLTLGVLAGMVIALAIVIGFGLI